MVKRLVAASILRLTRTVLPLALADVAHAQDARAASNRSRAQRPLVPPQLQDIERAIAQLTLHVRRIGRQIVELVVNCLEYMQ